MRLSKKLLMVLIASLLVFSSTALLIPGCSKDRDNPLDPGGPTPGDAFAVSAEMRPDGVVVTWNSPGVAGIKGYNVYRSEQETTAGTVIGNVSGAATTFTDRNVWHQKKYYYCVAALDAGDNESKRSQSDSLTVTGASLRLSTGAWVAPGAGGPSGYIKVSNDSTASKFEWVASADSDWVILSNSDGTVPDSFKVIASEPNRTLSQRSAHVIVTAADVTGSPDTLQVTQWPESTLVLCLLHSTWDAPDSGGTSDTITVWNCGASIVMPYDVDTGSDWLHIADSGDYDTPGFFRIKADSNYTGATRTGTVVVTVTGAVNSPDTVLVTQRSLPILYLSTNACDAPSSAGTTEPVIVENRGNGEILTFSAASRAAWLHVSPTSGTTPGSLAMTVDRNNTGDTRFGEIEVSAAGAYRSPQMLTVTQPPIRWLPLGTGMDDSVLALAVYNGKLIAGGKFTLAGGVPANHIAAWDGDSWSTLETGTSGVVLALTVYDGSLIAGGSFVTVGGVPVNNVARWDGTEWHAMGGGLQDDFETDDAVYALTVFNGQLIAGGNIDVKSDLLSDYPVAVWNGSSWSALGGWMGDQVRTLTVFSGKLVAGGDFEMAEVMVPKRNFIAVLDGGSWESLDDGVNASVHALAVFDNQLMVGGEFSRAVNPAVTLGHVGAWNGSNWLALGMGTDSLVRALTVFDTLLIAGGDFRAAGGTYAASVAAWNGGSWSQLGRGFDGEVRCLIVYNGKLVAGGGFVASGSDTLNRIAVWGE
jgi:hypothetical protein